MKSAMKPNTKPHAITDNFVCEFVSGHLFDNSFGEGAHFDRESWMSYQ